MSDAKKIETIKQICSGCYERHDAPVGYYLGIIDAIYAVVYLEEDTANA